MSEQCRWCDMHPSGIRDDHARDRIRSLKEALIEACEFMEGLDLTYGGWKFVERLRDTAEGKVPR